MASILLFDLAAGGHHRIYLERCAEALGERFRVVVAAPDGTADDLAALGVEAHGLGPPRPAATSAPADRQLADVELDLLAQSIRDVKPDHALHLYADPILRRLIRRPPLAARVSVLVFYPRSHYPRAYGSALPPKERARAWYRERLVSEWRRRPDAHAVFTLDEEAARRWARRSETPAYWFPEPPVPRMLPPASDDRSGCVLYGALSRHKGLELLADAMAMGPTSMELTLAGPVDDGFQEAVERSIERMRAAGVTVDATLRPHGELEGLGVLGRARCAVLPYPRHGGMSRVLLEACAVRTPVVVHAYGLLAHLVRRHGIGVVVDCRRPDELRRAILDLVGDPDASDRYAGGFAAFMARYSPERFRQALTTPFLA